MGYEELETALILHQAMLEDMRLASHAALGEGGGLQAYLLTLENARLSKLAQERHPLAVGDTPWEWGVRTRAKIEALEKGGHQFKSPSYPQPHERGNLRDALHVVWDGKPSEAPMRVNLFHENFEDQLRCAARSRHSHGFLGSRDAPARAFGTPLDQTLQSSLRRALESLLCNPVAPSWELYAHDSVCNAPARNGPYRGASGLSAPGNQAPRGADVGELRVQSPRRAITSRGPDRLVAQVTTTAVDKAPAPDQARPLGCPNVVPTTDPTPTPTPTPTPDGLGLPTVLVAASVGVLLWSYVLRPALGVLMGR